MRAHHVGLPSVLAALLVACGASKPVPAPPERDPEHAHPALPATVEAFHDVLSPVWKVQPGPDRVAAACDQAATLSTRATALLVEPAPAEAAGKLELWNLRTTSLAAHVEALATACKADERLDVEAKLASVHEAFHDVGAVVSGMGDHREHGPADGTGQHGGPAER